MLQNSTVTASQAGQEMGCVCQPCLSARAYLQGERGKLDGRVINLPLNSKQEVDEEAFGAISCYRCSPLLTISPSSHPHLLRQSRRHFFVLWSESSSSSISIIGLFTLGSNEINDRNILLLNVSGAAVRSSADATAASPIQSKKGGKKGCFIYVCSEWSPHCATRLLVIMTLLKPKQGLQED